MPNKWGFKKFDHPHLRVLLFVNEDEHLILVLLCKENLEHKEICATYLLKPPISMLLTHIHIVFLCLHSRFGFLLQEFESNFLYK